MDKEREIVIRRGLPDDANDFSRLVLHTAPKFLLYLFGYRVRRLMAQLFRHRNNAFSFEYSYFIEVDKKIAGTAIVYDYKQKKRHGMRTTLLTIRYMGWSAVRKAQDLLRAGSEVKVGAGESRLSYIALYPRFRGLGLGRRLLERIEEDVRKRGTGRIVLRTDVDNSKAISLYKKCGYEIQRKLPPLKVKRRDFHFFAISKEIGGMGAL
ncbi:MAG: GNAT family N-acetyltransferase [Candidatus Omnitrophota bacterium]